MDIHSLIHSWTQGWSVASASVGEEGFCMYLELGRGGPDAVASSADDGALVDVTGADEAVVKMVVSIRS
ncbi:hypothetical protein ACLX1H_009923 [Fusarium chlamydosporum]